MILSQKIATLGKQDTKRREKPCSI